VAVYSFLGNVKVLEVEKALLPQGLDEGLASSWFPSGVQYILGKVESDKLSPAEISL